MRATDNMSADVGGRGGTGRGPSVTAAGGSGVDADIAQPHVGDSPAHVSTAAARVPRQERGRRRVDDLLDASDALIGELGVAEASVHEIARRAGASIGSLYHFFPHKNAVVAALRTRYLGELDAISDRTRDRADEWARLPLPEFVDALITPFTAFLDRNPGFLAIAAVDTGEEVATSHAEALRTALSRRNPALPDSEHELRAAVLIAIVRGVTALLLQAPPARRKALLEEMTRAVVGYLAAGEPPAVTGRVAS